MKRVLLLTFLIVCGLSSYAQTEISNNRLTIEDVPLATEMSHVFYSDVPVKEKFGNAKSWVARSFGDYNSVVQLEDADNNRLIIKGGTPIEYRNEQFKGGSDITTFTFHFSENYIFTMIIDLKEDRFRIKFEDITIMVGSEKEQGLHEQKQIIPNEEVSLATRFGEGYSPDESSSSAIKIRKAFMELFNSASSAISTKDDF